MAKLPSGATLLLPLMVWVGGCHSPEPDTTLVSANSFGNPAAVASQHHVAFAPAPIEVAARVDLLGRKIVAANPQAGVRPIFRTIGSDQPEIFHNGTTEIDVTTGLVQQCRTEGELAAVLCVELGKMVAEREALAAPRSRQPAPRPPDEVRIGNDYGGSFGAPDQTHLAELAKYDQERRAQSAAPPPPPDPQVLAAIYLKKAQFSESDLQQVAPLLSAAAGHGTIEKQLTAPGPVQLGKP